MSEDELDFDIIDPKEVIILCKFDFAGKKVYPHKIKEVRELFTRVIPTVPVKFSDGKIASLFYPIEELRTKTIRTRLYEGARGTVMEDGIGYYYRHMGLSSERGKDIKRLHWIMMHNIDRLKVLDKCKIIWGEEDRSISTKYHEFKPFSRLEGWKDIELSDNVRQENKKKFDEKFGD